MRQVIVILEAVPLLETNVQTDEAQPRPPVGRDWIVLDDTQKNNPNAGVDTFQVLSYNILCDRYATASQYGYAANWTLDWNYRSQQILKQLLDSQADIICLQEVDADSYDDFFLRNLTPESYKGVHQPKSRAKTMSESERKKVDGCATFFKSTK